MLVRDSELTALSLSLWTLYDILDNLLLFRLLFFDAPCSSLLFQPITKSQDVFHILCFYQHGYIWTLEGGSDFRVFGSRLTLGLQLLQPAVQIQTFTNLAVTERFVLNCHGTETLLIRIDARYVLSLLSCSSSFTDYLASLLLNQAQWATTHQWGGPNMQAGENLALQICCYLSLPITLIFVLNGPDQPSIKHDQKVKTKPHALTQAYVELIKRAGFYTYIVCVFLEKVL